jgi:ubiquinone/menaquinone biosynthesis C-methylase UbiE
MLIRPNALALGEYDGWTPAPAHAAQSPVLGRINATFFTLMDGYMHWKYRELKQRLFGTLPTRVIEIGAGAGANFRYYQRGTSVLAAEPNVHMHDALRRRARQWNLDLRIDRGGAETLDVPDGSVEAVVSSLVLCTVHDPERVVREVRRVLAPGGRFICIEHVAAPPSTFIGRLQRLVFRPWRWFFEGCHTHRDTAGLLEGAGFSHVEIQPFTWRSMFLPVRPQIAAVCKK